jgi:hypothetical protein
VSVEVPGGRYGCRRRVELSLQAATSRFQQLGESASHYTITPVQLICYAQVPKRRVQEGKMCSPTRVTRTLWWSSYGEIAIHRTGSSRTIVAWSLELMSPKTKPADSIAPRPIELPVECYLSIAINHWLRLCKMRRQWTDRSQSGRSTVRWSTCGAGGTSFRRGSVHGRVNDQAVSACLVARSRTSN